LILCSWRTGCEIVSRIIALVSCRCPASNFSAQWRDLQRDVKRTRIKTSTVIPAKAGIQVVTCAKRKFAALRADGLGTGFQPSLE